MIDTYHAPRPMHFALGALATWRITHLIVDEDGPADAVLRIRRVAGSGALGQLMDCFYCTSIWVALPFAAELMYESSIRTSSQRTDVAWPAICSSGVLRWLALSGAACLLEQATRSEDESTLAESLGELEDEEDTTRPRSPLISRNLV
jgi:hypothetical protein